MYQGAEAGIFLAFVGIKLLKQVVIEVLQYRFLAHTNSVVLELAACSFLTIFITFWHFEPHFLTESFL